MNNPIITKLEDIIKAEGFDQFGFSPFTKPISLSFYKSWIDRGFHGEMEYLQDHLPIKEAPQAWLPRAQSAIVLAFNYLPHPSPQPQPVKHLKIARYARGEDYHYFLKERLNSLILRLQENYPDEFFVAHTDSSPIMERDLAYRAQLGWFGKNSCIIHPKKGSFFLLAEVLTSLSLENTQSPIVDFCGTCTRCIDQCPTQAIREDRSLDAQKCISYLNIELKGLPPKELIPRMGEWFFGCDICQEVCPWNKKAFGNQLEDKVPSREEKLEDLRFILSSSNKYLEKTFHHSPLLRRRGFGLKRNALVVAANISAVELTSEIRAVSDLHERLAPLAQWVLESFKEKDSK